MKVLTAALQMTADLLQGANNLERADALLGEAHRVGAALAVLPEMFHTGYGLLPDFGPYAERVGEGPMLRHLSRRCREWRMGIAAGFVERDGRDLFDAMALCLPDGSIHVYRKRRLVFWELFRFRSGRASLVVSTPWGRVGLAVCADMMDRRVWDDYRGRVDLMAIASAWPEFACRHTGRKHWLLGQVGPMAGVIPAKVAQDLNVPVIFANQCGTTQTTIPILGLVLSERIADRFAGRSSVCDGQRAPAVIAGAEPGLVLSEVTTHGPQGSRP